MIDIYPVVPPAPAHVAGAYGEMYVRDNVTSQVIAQSPTFTQWTTGWIVGENNGVTPAVTGNMTINTTGVYMVTFSGAATVASTNQVLEFALHLNGVYQGDHSVHVTFPNNTTLAFSMSGILTMANGDILTLRATNTTSAGKALTIEDCNLSVHQV